jgi:hypothetical protein
LSTLPNAFRVASYWNAAATGSDGGFGAFVHDMHMTSTVRGSKCPDDCPHCVRDSDKYRDKWDLPQYQASTIGSLGFFDTLIVNGIDHQAALTEALVDGLQSGGLALCSDESVGVGGFSLHPHLDRWHRTYLFGTLHSMETERTMGKIHRAYGPSASQLTAERLFLKVSDLRGAVDVAGGQYAEWRRQVAMAAAVRKEKKAATGGDPSGHQAKLLEAVAVARLKAAATAERQHERTVATAAAEAAAIRRGIMARRRDLVNSLRFVKVKRAALVALEALPDVEAATKAVGELSLVEVQVRLLSPECGTIEQLQAAVTFLLAQVNETVAGDKEKKKKKKVTGAKRRRMDPYADVPELSLAETRRIAADTRATRRARRDAGGVETAADFTVDKGEGSAGGSGDESESESGSSSSSKNESDI